MLPTGRHGARVAAVTGAAKDAAADRVTAVAYLVVKSEAAEAAGDGGGGWEWGGVWVERRGGQGKAQQEGRTMRLWVGGLG